MERTTFFRRSIFLLAGLVGGAHAAQTSASVAPADAVRTFELDPGLELQLVAAEPLVANPVAMSFDEDGRLFVVEMIDYPNDRARKIGRISRLEDTDGDGRFDKSVVFAEGFAWPSGIICAAGGVFVASTPDLVFLKDTDGDGRADVREVVFTGFGSTMAEVSPDMVFNGFNWGLENRIFGATARNGGVVKPTHGDAPPLDLRGRDFSWDPLTRTMRPESGTAQFGLSLDDFGRHFVCSNHNHLMMVMYDYRYATRNPAYDLPSPLLDVPPDRPAAELFRISPEEPWRVMRTQLRVAGKVRGPVEGGGKPSGYFTSAAGVTIYRGDALPAGYYGNAFIAEPANNLVHRKVVKNTGIVFEATRPPEEAKREFLASRDLWFRPVNFANAPDGALYVADMYRELIEDPRAIPPEIVKDLDTNAGNDMGRIYRIVPKGFRQPKLPRLSRASNQELVALLEHSGGWYRDTAARLIYERQDRSIAPALSSLARKSALPVGRVRCLYALEGLGALTAGDVETALADSNADVREQAVSLAETWLQSATGRSDADASRIRKQVIALATDSSPRVRYQVAFTLGQFPASDDVAAALLGLASADLSNMWIRSAVLSSLTEGAGLFFQQLAASPLASASDDGREFLGDVLGILGARGKVPELRPAAALLAGRLERDGRRSLPLLVEFCMGLRRSGVALASIDSEGRLGARLHEAVTLALNGKASTAERMNAIRLAAMDHSPATDEALLGLLGTKESQRVQIEVLATLASSTGPAVAREIVGRWPEFTPRLREEAMKLLLARPERARLLLEAVQAKKIQPSDLSATQQAFLRGHADARVKQLAANALPAATTGRARVLEDYQDALTLPADAERGRAVFTKICAGCHRLEGAGVEVGPNLLTAKSGGKAKLLTSILDPNREVDPAYLFYQIETKDAGVLLGAIGGETANTLTVKQAYGAQIVVTRANIVRMQSLGQSLMPEGLEAGISHQEMADLLEFISQARL